MRLCVDIPGSTRGLEAVLMGLVGWNQLYLRLHPATPTLYASGVRYRNERPGREDWLTVPQMMKLGHADCEDLVGWRCAELRNASIAALPFVLAMKPGLWHVVVRYHSGRIEDPSAKLGMRTPQGYPYAR